MLPPYSTNALALSTPAKQKQKMSKTLPFYSTTLLIFQHPLMFTAH